MKKQESKKVEMFELDKEGLYPVIIDPFNKNYKMLHLNLFGVVRLHDVLTKFLETADRKNFYAGVSVIEDLLGQLEKKGDLERISKEASDFETIHKALDNAIRMWDVYPDKTGENYSEDLPF